jgi:hypothetical protein
MKTPSIPVSILKAEVYAAGATALWVFLAVLIQAEYPGAKLVTLPIVGIGSQILAAIFAYIFLKGR